MDISDTIKDHQRFMLQAIELGENNRKFPFGALLVHKVTGVIVGKGWNQTKEKNNPTLHGEMVAINDCLKTPRSEKDFWNNLILYTTAEPCAMCQGAILWLRISKVVFGSSIPFLKTLPPFAEAIDIRARAIADCWTNQKERCLIVAGVLEQECNDLFERAVERPKAT